MVADMISAVPDPLVTSDPERMGGPVFAGTPMPSRMLFEFLEEGASVDEFPTSGPDIARERTVEVLEPAKRSALARAEAAEQG